METANLLPTHYKSKLPPRLVHPVGAQIVSQVMAGASQYEHIYLRFLGPAWNPKIRGQFYVASGSYTDPRMTVMQENWTINVSAIPREFASQVKELLLGEGLPAIRSWIEAKHNPIWYSSSKDFTICFDTNRQSLVYTESGRP